jgi:hypothetical protein
MIIVGVLASSVSDIALTPQDADWKYVMMRMTFDELNGMFKDVSTNRSPVLVANAITASSTPKFDNYGSIVQNAGGCNTHTFAGDFIAIGAQIFTIEYWLYFTSATGNIVPLGVWDDINTTGFSSWRMQVRAGVLYFQYTTNGNTASLVEISGGSITTSAWNHIAVSKDGTGKVRLFVNGVMTGSATAVPAFFTPLTNFAIGGNNVNSGNSNSSLTPRIDDLRISVALCRYSVDTSFAVPSSAYPIDGPKDTTVFPRLTQLGFEVGNKNASSGNLSVTQLGFEILRKP